MATFDDVRRIATALPEPEEVLTWETDVTFRVRRKDLRSAVTALITGPS